ncbi:cupin domain-containing protein [Herbiconiux sp.]|uniref:cupin domain-containing protein n=1 Tax=Herbiconiux sp. TaxID=1871186 RepID=UPI0025BF41E7|nr:cupin domain-containing protein [Herbiconiux sp.]
MHIPASSSREITTPDGTIWKYAVKDEVGISYQTLNTSSPESGRHLNKEVHEIYFIIQGTATFTVGDETFEVSDRDIVVVEPMVAHSIETDGLTFMTITRPDWFFEQYEHVGA